MHRHPLSLLPRPSPSWIKEDSTRIQLGTQGTQLDTRRSRKHLDECFGIQGMLQDVVHLNVRFGTRVGCSLVSQQCWSIHLILVDAEGTNNHSGKWHRSICTIPDRLVIRVVVINATPNNCKGIGETGRRLQKGVTNAPPIHVRARVRENVTGGHPIPAGWIDCLEWFTETTKGKVGRWFVRQ